MKKRARLAIPALAVLGVLAVGCGRSSQRRVAELAERFFDHLRAEQVEAAYAMIAEGASAPDEFGEAVAASGMLGHQGVTWEAAYVDDDYGRVRGTVRTRDGQSLRMDVIALRRERNWEIHIVREASDDKPSPLAAGAAPMLPTRDAALDMARTAIRHFVESVHAGSMAGFHRQTSALLQEQVTVEQFDEGFSAFYELRELGADFTVLNAAVPELDESFDYDTDGILTIRGVYREPRQAEFQQLYIVQDGEWKLIEFHMDLKNLVDWVP